MCVHTAVDLLSRFYSRPVDLSPNRYDSYLLVYSCRVQAIYIYQLYDQLQDRLIEEEKEEWLNAAVESPLKM